MQPKPSSHEPRRFIPNIFSGENGHSDTLTITGGIFSFWPLASQIFTLNIDQVQMGSSSPCQDLYSNRDQLGKPKGIHTKEKFDYSSVP